jgi:hypothetical protein
MPMHPPNPLEAMEVEYDMLEDQDIQVPIVLAPPAVPPEVNIEAEHDQDRGMVEMEPGVNMQDPNNIGPQVVDHLHVASMQWQGSTSWI